MMLRSKSSRSSVFGDVGDKSNDSVLSRTFSASKFCRGDNIGKSVDPHALKPFGRRSLDRNPSKSSRFSESQIQRALMVQEHMGQLEEELKWAKDRIFVVEEERKKEVTRLANDANMKVNESLAKTKNVGELMGEIKSLRDELNKVKASEALAMNQLLSSKQKIEELEDEIKRCKVSEAKMIDSLKSQAKELEQEKVEVQESKLKIMSLEESKLKIMSLEESIKHNGNNLNDPGPGCDEMEVLRKELRSALNAEEKSKKAMDDLALVLTEVANESNQTKEKLRSTEFDLDNVKAEAQQLKQMVRNTEEKYEKLLEEAIKESELHRNTADRLRIEAEESLMAWNGKEIGFVSCIKRAEEEKAVVQHEKNKLVESHKSAEHIAKTAREDSYKLRDILKQAINEANAAKASSAIATDENSQLKDCLAEKDEALHSLTRENERLRINEAAAFDNIKELKRFLSKPSKKFKNPGMVIENHDELKKARKTFSFNLHELKLYNDSGIKNELEEVDELKGTIFDSDSSPRSEPPHITEAEAEEVDVVHHKRESSTFTDDDETTNSEDVDHLEGSNFDDSDSDRNQNRRRTMFRRVGDLIRRRSTYKSSNDHPTS